jgi:hypothetical protein
MANEIKYIVTVDANGFTTAINQATGETVKLENILKKTGETGNQTSKSLTVSMRDLTLAFNGAIQAVTTIYNATKQFTDSSIASTQATKNLTTEQIAYSEVLEEQTGVNDTIISQAQTSLKVMGLNNDQVKEATKYTTDLVNGGISLEDAMKKSAAMVTKNYGELGELIPAIKTATTEQEKQSLAIDYFSKKAELSKQSMEGMAGAEKRMANEITDVKEKFGSALNTAILPMLQALTPMVKLVGDNMPVALGILSGAIFTKAVPAMIALVTQIRAAGVASAFATGGLSAIGGILGSLAMVGGTAWIGYNAGAKEAIIDTSKVTGNILKLNDDIKELQKQISGASDEQLNKLEKTMSDLIDNYVKEQEFNKLLVATKKQKLAEQEQLLNESLKNEERQTTLNQIRIAEIETEKVRKIYNIRKKQYDELRELIDNNYRNDQTFAETGFKVAESLENERNKKKIENQKNVNIQSENILKEYQQKVAQIGKEGFELEKLQTEQASKNTTDNLKKLLEEGKINKQSYNDAIYSEELLLNEKLDNITEKHLFSVMDKHLEHYNKMKVIRDEYDTVGKNLENEKVSASDAINKQIEDMTVARTKSTTDNLALEFQREYNSYLDMLNQKKISQDEFDAWFKLRQEKFSSDIKVSYEEIAKEVGNILADAFKDIFNFDLDAFNKAKDALSEQRDSEKQSFDERLEAIDREKQTTALAYADRRRLELERAKLLTTHTKEQKRLNDEEAELNKSRSDRYLEATRVAVKASIDMLAAKGAAAAFASVFETIPYPLNLVLAPVAFAGAYTTISATKSLFKTGGYTGDGSVNDEAGIVHRKEFVTNAETTKRVGVPALEMLQRNEAIIVPVSSYESPEYIGNSSSFALGEMNNSIGALSSNLSSGSQSQREVIVINNSDLVKITKRIEQTKSENSYISTNKSTRSYA